MEIFVLEQINMHRSEFMQKRIGHMEEQLKRLLNICTELYRIHSYKREDSNSENKAKWDEARRELSKIEKNSWNEEKDTLNLYKAQAFCYLGTVYEKLGDYDEALNNLNRTRKLIEKLSAECIIPECYARACMGLAKCYMEKHSNANMIEECYTCARETIEGMDKQSGRFLILNMELLLMEAIAKMELYRIEEYDARGKIENTYRQPYILEVLPLIEKAKSVQKQLLGKEMSGLLDKEWLEKIDATLRTTEADYYKKLYLKISNDDLCQETDGVWDGKLLNQYFETALKLFAETINMYPENTMGINSIATLLYDYYQKENDDYYQKENDRGYLQNLLNQLKQEYDIINTFNQSSIPDVIGALLDKTLSVEDSNMFALNMKAVLSGNNHEMSTIDHYQMLRQSSLKQRFRKLGDIVGDICPEALRDIMINLIMLHNKASEFMDSAIIDFTDPQWRELKVGHYTSLKVLPKLINRNPNSRLRIQNVHHLNDPLEGVLFVDLLGKKFEGKYNRQESVIENLLALYGSEKNGTVRNSVYMGSFTSRLDQLNMWMRYGDGGNGCSLQLDAARSFDMSAKISLDGLFTDESVYSYTMDNTRYPLYMVLYLPRKDTEKLDESEKYARDRANTSRQEQAWWNKQADMIAKLTELMGHVEYTINRINSDFEKIGKRLDDKSRKKARGELCNTIMLILDLVRFLIKSDYYRDEREYRIIQYSSDPEYHTEDGTPKLYIYVEKKMVYEKICFGPLVQNFDSQAAYVLNIKKEKMAGEPKKTWNLEVCKSDIDYR